ncbi:MAG: TetR/AcrR family transcriptional regulator [Treponema sp.]|nr:TetR/AcrR family transcriptional regulator [Treponema sp.]
MLQKSGKPNRQVERTKSWIFEAVMLLMDENSYDKITVSDICEKAGVARPTFYRNYNDKDDVVFEYLMNSFGTELLNMEKSQKDDKQDIIVLMFDFKFMTKHQKNLKKILAVADIENRIFRELQKYPISFIKHYKSKLTTHEYLVCRYKLCFQITGSLRVIFDWFVNDMPMPIESIVEMLNAMNIPKVVQYRNIPSIVVRIKKE